MVLFRVHFLSLFCAAVVDQAPSFEHNFLSANKSSGLGCFLEIIKGRAFVCLFGFSCFFGFQFRLESMNYTFDLCLIGGGVHWDKSTNRRCAF